MKPVYQLSLYVAVAPMMCVQGYQKPVFSQPVKPLTPLLVGVGFVRLFGFPLSKAPLELYGVAPWTEAKMISGFFARQSRTCWSMPSAKPLPSKSGAAAAAAACARSAARGFGRPVFGNRFGSNRSATSRDVPGTSVRLKM